MKAKFLTLFALGVATAASQAFTIDFNSLVPVTAGTIVDSTTPLTVTVVGYGDVMFEVTNPDSLIVGSTHRNGSGTINNSLELESGEVVVVTFLGPQALNVNFDIIGINDGDSSTQVPIGLSGDLHQVNSIGSGNGVGIAAVSWNTVPEPSSSLLVLVGAGSLILRRRRG